MSGGSLRLRLLLATVASVLLGLGLAVLGLSALFTAHVERRAIEELSVQLDQLLAGIGRDADSRLVIGEELSDARFSRPLGGLYWQVESAGRRIRSRSLWDYALPMPSDDLADGAVHAHRLQGPTGAPVLALEREVRLPARLGGGRLRAAVAMDAARLRDEVGDFRGDLLPFTALLAVFLIVAGALQVAVGLRPLGRIGKRVAEVRSGETARIGSAFPSEIVPLAREVDELLAQREKEIARARHRAGDLAHGLKTPLQALLGEASRLRATGNAAAAAAIEQIADTMRRHMDRELTRARIATRGTATRCDLALAVGRVVNVVRRVGGHAALDWAVAVPSDIVVAGESEELSETLGALIENAARHARTRVEIGAGKRDGMAVLTLRDDGPGIPASDKARLMQRGVRADETGAGTGLGLAIAREISEALGGSLALTDAAPGLCVTLRLPLVGG